MVNLTWILMNISNKLDANIAQSAATLQRGKRLTMRVLDMTLNNLMVRFQ